MIEATYDPTDALNDAIDASRTQHTRVDPLGTLAQMFLDNELSKDERDAGEILHEMAKVVHLPNGKPSAVVGYPYRAADGKWLVASAQRAEVKRRFNAALASIRNDRRLQAVSRLLVAREPVEDTPAQIALGLEDVANHFWPKQVNTHSRGGITLAGPNDATAERLQHTPDTFVDKAGARWVVDGFERMFMRGQLDEDEDVNEALHAAGLRYQEEHYRAGLSPLGAIDYSRGAVDGSGQQLMSESMEAYRRKWRNARMAMGDRYGPVVDAVVLEGQTLSAVGALRTKYTDKGKANAAAGEMLNAGLRRLAAHYDNPKAAANDNVAYRGWHRASQRIRDAIPAKIC